jgi:hypothetical protein
MLPQWNLSPTCLSKRSIAPVSLDLCLHLRLSVLGVLAFWSFGILGQGLSQTLSSSSCCRGLCIMDRVQIGVGLGLGLGLG